ncbi:guanylate kinase [Candidatus Deianiraea vastatrix]|uniref:Guanylate kinase n=1 Tax=Candidatus Deianiraea vastatrix TaxID=2163644 RepID=A0A5B8XCK9_9RICK|nr:guanylate kinase [Candidatus Deianiraea vastatrix]QED22816.1 Guanylate kinase [Candidatus Deianiraea vastatrix]
MLFIISSPSGAGKSTLCSHLLCSNDEIGESISVTTRQARQSESDGIHYYFKTIQQYEDLVAKNEFLEHANFCGNYYGTLKSEIERIKTLGKTTILFDIDYQGARQIKAHDQFDIVSVFIMPPSFEILENRLRNRKTDSQDAILKRIESAKKEINFAGEYDYIIINDRLDVAKNEITSIYTAETLRRKRGKYINMIPDYLA